MTIDGHFFVISEKHGVPNEVMARFWDLFKTNPKYEDIPQDLMVWERPELADSLPPLPSQEDKTSPPDQT